MSTANVSMVAAALLLAACEPIGATALFPAPSTAPVYGRAPFPSDLFLDERGHIGAIAGLDAVAPASTDALQAQLAALDGWGSRPVIEFFFDAPIDPRS